MVDLITDSRKVKQGDTFIAIRGVDRDGHDYINQAILNGASTIICEEGSYNVETIIVPSTREYLENYLYNKYYTLIKDIKLVGVTGTNGKTTICYLAYEMLKKLGKKVAYIGTIGFYMMEEQEELNNTTPDIIDLYNMFLRCLENGIEVIILEVSSHSLDMRRVNGLEFNIAAFSNLTQDHLDYHKNFDNYVLAKKKLFYQLRGKKIAIINNDNHYSDQFILEENNNLTISKVSGDVLIRNIEYHDIETKIIFEYNNNIYNSSIKMVGEYNVYNYLMSLLIVHKLGNLIEEIIKLDNSLILPPGRMELVTYNKNRIFIDYAHNPDGVLNVLEIVNKHKKGKIITVVGCTGNRDRGKRPLMGEISTTMSDYVIFTNDDPRKEDEKIIMDDITSNLKKDNYKIIYDRKKAIFKGMSLLSENDTLLILGKGHETSQIIGDKKVPFNDKQCVLEYIEK